MNNFDLRKYLAEGRLKASQEKVEEVKNIPDDIEWEFDSVIDQMDAYNATIALTGHSESTGKNYTASAEASRGGSGGDWEWMEEDEVEEEALEEKKGKDHDGDIDSDDYLMARDKAIKANLKENLKEKEGQMAASKGKKYSENPYEKGTEDHLNWSKGHNSSRARKLNLKEWGSSDWHYFLDEMHTDLGEPTDAPDIFKVLDVAGDAVDKHWDDWEEYETDREGLNMHAAQTYLKTKFPEYFKGMQALFAPMNEESIEESLRAWAVIDIDGNITHEGLSYEEALAKAKKVEGHKIRPTNRMLGVNENYDLEQELKQLEKQKKQKIATQSTQEWLIADSNGVSIAEFVKAMIDQAAEFNGEEATYYDLDPASRTILKAVGRKDLIGESGITEGKLRINEGDYDPDQEQLDDEDEIFMPMDDEGRPLGENVDKKYSDFLIALRDSGTVNMFGAAPHLQAEFGLDKREAREILANWMKSFKESLQEALNPEVVKAVNRLIKGLAKKYDYSDRDAVYAIIAALRQEGYSTLTEGYYGSSDIDTIASTLGYDDIDNFFNDNPGAVDAIMQWAETVPDFERMLQDAGMIEEDLDLGHQDDEPGMLKGDLYKIGKYSMELYQMMDDLEDIHGEVDLPHWWQSKITTAKNMISGAKHYLEFELKEPAVDAMVTEDSLEDQAKVYFMQKVKRGEIDTLPEDPKAAFLVQMMKDQIDHDKETLRKERGLGEASFYTKSVKDKVVSKLMDQLKK